MTIQLGASVRHRGDTDHDSMGIVICRLKFLDGHVLWRVSWADHSESDHIDQELVVEDPGQWSAG